MGGPERICNGNVSPKCPRAAPDGTKDELNWTGQDIPRAGRGHACIPFIIVRLSPPHVVGSVVADAKVSEVTLLPGEIWEISRRR
jgi:hypothetical protein